MIGEISKVCGDGAHWVRGIGFGTTNPDGMSSCKNVVDGINLPWPSGFNNMTFGSNHPGGAQFAIADGSVRFLQETMDFQLYKSLCSRNGREAASLP